MQYSSHGWNAESRVLFETNPLKPLGDLLEREALLTNRVQQEFNSGEEYWALERKLCHALSNKNKVTGSVYCYLFEFALHLLIWFPLYLYRSVSKM
jgi:hypothetical protein